MRERKTDRKTDGERERERKKERDCCDFWSGNVISTPMHYNCLYTSILYIVS